jgi:hypothetical protein
MRARCGACQPIGYGRDLANIIGVIFFISSLFFVSVVPLGQSKSGSHILKILLARDAYDERPRQAHREICRSCGQVFS